MDEFDARRIVATALDGLAAFIEVLGMAAENQWRLTRDEAIAYREDAFNERSQFISACANSLMKTHG